MLNEAVKEAKGEEVLEDKFETSIDIGTDAFIPPAYIANEFQKLDIYKRIAGLWNDEECDEMLEELIDRFGEPPKSVLNLLTIARLKAKAHKLYVTEIVQKGNELKIKLFARAKIDPAMIPVFVEKYASYLKFAMDAENPYFIYALKSNSREKNKDTLEILSELLDEMQMLILEEEKS